MWEAESNAQLGHLMNGRAATTADERNGLLMDLEVKKCFGNIL